MVYVKKERGVTLIEALIAMAIVGLLLVIVYKAFVPSMEKFKKADAQTEAQQNALVAYQKVFSELSLTCPESITITTSPIKSISFLSFRDPSIHPVGPPISDSDIATHGEINPSIEWKKFVIIYPGEATAPAGNKVKVLYKKEIPYTKGNAIYFIKSDRVPFYINDSRYAEKVIAQHIQDVNYAMPKYPGVLIEIISTKRTGVAQRTHGKARYESMRFVFTIYPRN